MFFGEKDAFTRRDFFRKWIMKFKKVDNIEVYCSRHWDYFCQFENGNLRENFTSDYVKIYIPLASHFFYSLLVFV